MPAYDHHFLPLHPPLEGKSYLALQSHGLVNIKTQSGHTLLVRFLCLDEQVRIIAVSVPEEVTSHPDLPKWLKQTIESAVSAIRLSVDPEANPFYVGDEFLTFVYQSDDAEPRYQIAIEFPIIPDYKLDIANVIGVFGSIHKKTLAPIAALLAEGQLPFLPPHYRALSLIRAIELLYPDESDRCVALDQFETHFAKLGLGNQSLRNLVPQLRTRCAHGRSRGRTNPKPFTGIGYNEANLLKLVRLLQSVVAHGIQILHGMEFGGMQYSIEPSSIEQA